MANTTVTAGPSTLARVHVHTTNDPIILAGLGGHVHTTNVHDLLSNPSLEYTCTQLTTPSS